MEQLLAGCNIPVNSHMWTSLQSLSQAHTVGAGCPQSTAKSNKAGLQSQSCSSRAEVGFSFLSSFALQPSQHQAGLCLPSGGQLKSWHRWGRQLAEMPHRFQVSRLTLGNFPSSVFKGSRAGSAGSLSCAAFFNSLNNCVYWSEIVIWNLP